MEIYSERQLRALESQKRGDLGEKEAALFFTKFGWPADKLPRDDGEDLFVEVRDNFFSSGLKLQVQVKTPEKLKRSNNSFCFDVETKHLQRWREMVPPVFILLWKIGKDQGYWQAVADVIESLDKSVPNWAEQETVRVSFPASNTTDLAGLKKLRRRAANLVLPYVAQGKRMHISLAFSFPSTSEGKAENEAMRHHFRTGEGTSVSSKFIQAIRFPDWYERLFGPDLSNDWQESGALFRLGPSHSQQRIEFHLTVVSPAGKRIGHQIVWLRAIAVGEEQTRFSNRDEPNPFVFEVLARSDGHYTLTFSLQGSVSSARELNSAFPFLDALAQSGTLRVQAFQQEETGAHRFKFEMPFPSQTAMVPHPTYRKLVAQMADIESRTGVSFKLDDSGVNQEEMAILNEVSEILSTGHRSYDFQQMSFTLAGFNRRDVSDLFLDEDPKFHFNRPESPSEWIKSIVDKNSVDKPTHFDMVCDVELRLLSVLIPLGPQRMKVDAQLTSECYERFKSGLKNGESFDPVVFQLENGRSQETFPDWLPAA